MKKALSIILVLSVLFSLSVLSASADTEYTGTAPGRNGDVVVHITIDANGAVTDVTAEHEETPGLGDAAIAQLSDEVLKTQSVPVDGVSGATLSSTGFLTALTSALEQAGVSLGEVSDGDDLEYKTEADVLVIGGGMAGVSAALDCAAAGLNVILLEKEGLLGGSSIRCDGMLLAGGTQLQKDSDVEDSAEAFYQEMLELHSAGYTDPDMLKV